MRSFAQNSAIIFASGNKRNPQGISYALMKAKSLGNRGLSSVRFVVIQPRCFHEEGPVREFVVEGVDMLEWEDKIVDAISKINEAAQAARDKKWAEKYLATGAQCRWCKAAGICPALEKKAEDELKNTYSAAAPYDVEAVAKSLNLLPEIEAMCKAKREFAYAEAERGVKFPGWKLVQKRPVRRWRDPKDIEGALSLFGFAPADIFEPAEIKSPAQMEAAIESAMDGKTKKARTAAAKEFISPYIEAVSSGHTLVPESDARAPIRGDAADDFAAVE